MLVWILSISLSVSNNLIGHHSVYSIDYHLSVTLLNVPKVTPEKVGHLAGCFFKSRIVSIFYTKDKRTW